MLGEVIGLIQAPAIMKNETSKDDITCVEQSVESWLAHI